MHSLSSGAAEILVRVTLAQVQTQGPELAMHLRDLAGRPHLWHPEIGRLGSVELVAFRDLEAVGYVALVTPTPPNELRFRVTPAGLEVASAFHQLDIPPNEPEAGLPSSPDLLVGGGVTVVTLLLLLFDLQGRADSALRALDLPPTIDFYVLFFWAAVTASVGAVAYNFFARGTHLGGTNAAEPRGLVGFAWGLITHLPVGIGIGFLAAYYGIWSVARAASTATLFGLGAGLGALGYYGRWWRGASVREVVERTRLSFRTRELVINAIWATSISACALIGIVVANAIFSPARTLPFDVWAEWLTIAIMVAGLTNYVFIVVAGNNPLQRSTRGVVAALALRGVLFFAAFFVAAV